MSIEFIDGDPPGGPGAWNKLRQEQTRQFADELKLHPGRWAVWPFPTTALAARAVATRISNGRTSAFAEGFLAVSRGDVVYVRYGKGRPGQP